MLPVSVAVVGDAPHTHKQLCFLCVSHSEQKALNIQRLSHVQFFGESRGPERSVLLVRVGSKVRRLGIGEVRVC